MTATGKRADAQPLKQQVSHADGWVNCLTGIGDSLRDKAEFTNFVVDRLDPQTLEDVWRCDDIAARIVETIPNEMTRQGWEVQIEGEKEMGEDMDGFLEGLASVPVFREAFEYARAYGGSGILLGINDGAKNLALPLNEDNIQSIDFITTLTPRELWPIAWYIDPRKPKFGEAALYNLVRDSAGGPVSQMMFPIHESRIIRFEGVKVSRRQLREFNGWGDSVLVRCLRIISRYQQTWTGVTTMLQDFAQAIMKVKGLAELVADNQDDIVVKRAQLVDMSRSMARAVLIDADEEFERKSTPLAGLPETLDKMTLRLCATARMPVSLLMGQAPAGLNATGDSDIRWFYDQVQSDRERVARERLNRLIKLAFLCKTGPTKGVLPDGWKVHFPPLWQMSDTDKADVRLKMSQADAAYVQAGVLSPEEVALSRFGGDSYSMETKLSTPDRAAIAEAAVEAEADKAAKLTEATTPADAKKPNETALNV